MTFDRHRFAQPEHRGFSAEAHDFLDGFGCADNFDSGDIWGSLMLVAFEANDEACRRGLPTDPTYNPGMGGPPSPDDDGFDYTTVVELDDERLVALVVGISPLLHQAVSLGLDY